MAPRGTRRPHARRVRSKPVKVKRRSGGGGGKKGGCGKTAGLFLFALAVLPTLAVVVIR